MRTAKTRTWVINAALCVAVAGGCTHIDSDGSVDSASAPAIDAAIPEAFTMRFEIPTGANLSDIAVLGEDSVNLADRVQVPGLTASVDGAVAVASDARVRGLTARLDVRLGDRSQANGNIVAGGRLLRGNGATVSGTVATGTAPVPRTVEWQVPATAKAFGAVSTNPDELRTLEPGTYKDWALKSRSKVTLTSGVYVVQNLAVESDAQLRINDGAGPVQIYVKGTVTFRGRVVSTAQRAPQLLLGVVGQGQVMIEAPFDGVIVAPQSDLRLQAARPNGHRAVVIGRNVRLEPDTMLRGSSFDWVDVVGPTFDPQPGPSVPVQQLPSSPFDDLDVSIAKEGPGSGEPTTTTINPGRNISFRIKEKLPVAGGIIGNGTVIFKYTQPNGAEVTCTYRGGSSTATPETPEELTKGRYLTLVSCSDGSNASTPRIGTTFTMTVNPVPGLPVDVAAPITEDYSCSEEFELLSAEQTMQMHQSFNWSQQRKVAGRTPDGRPTLFYAWVYIQSKAEALALKKLAIHVLSRPLFNEELDQYSGKCGSFTNPGDGTGTFVPVLIPGDTYNKLIDALTSDAVQGDRVIFDAVILRDVPAAARTSVGSVRLDLLAQAKFRYLSYESDPFNPNIQLDGGVTKLLTDALEWVATAARDVGEFVTNTLGELDKFFRGEVRVTLHAQAVSHDPAFSGSTLHVMERGWGSSAGNKLSARDMQVTVLQKLFDTPIPSTAQGWTDFNGRAVINAVEDASARGSGLCLELKTPSAMITDFLHATEICDLRGFDPSDPISANATPDDLRLRDFSRDFERRLVIDNTRVAGLVQADDAYQWSSAAAGFTPRRARILSGYWAATFAPNGGTRLFAPCLNYPNTVSDGLGAAAAGAGWLVAGPVGAISAGVFATVISNSDIVMSTKSKLRASRQVMSHEYGHFVFCSMLQAKNGSSVDHVIWSIITSGDSKSVPTRYMNEAFADYITGQVAGAADYKWLSRAVDASLPGEELKPTYCTPDTQPCWDENLNGVATSDKSNDSIARVATLMHDAFDGHGQRFSTLPGDGDVWVGTKGSLILSPTGYGNTDAQLERVALPGSWLPRFAGYLSDGLLPLTLGDSIDDAKIYGALNSTMKDAGESWCDRCRVLALHEPGRSPTNVKELFETCSAGGLSGGAVGPAPVADLRIDANSCSACPAGSVSDENGECKVCTGTIIGNRCETCASDVVIDAATVPFGAQVFASDTSAPNDTCPEVLWVEVRNGAQAFARGANLLEATLSAPDQASCDVPLSIDLAGDTPDGFTVIDSKSVQSGWLGQSTCVPGQVCLIGCKNMPQFSFGAGTLPNGTFRFGTARRPNMSMSIDVNRFTTPL